MTIETTIRMNKRTLEKLNDASKQLKLPRTYLIRLLLKQFIQDNRKIKIFGGVLIMKVTNVTMMPNMPKYTLKKHPDIKVIEELTRRNEELKKLDSKFDKKV